MSDSAEATRPALARTIVRAARPHQWVKNAFVIAPFAFAGPELARTGHLDAAHAARVCLATVAFCLVSSATYLLNDLLDVEADRLHPVKRRRPIAAGDLPIGAAWRSFAALLAVGTAIAVTVEPSVAAIVLAYVAVNIAYSRWLKRFAYIDAAVISAGFLFRTLAGGEAASVHLSRWLMGTTVLLALFLALGKRKHELLTADLGHRAALQQYRVEHLNFALGALAAATAVTYALYTRDVDTIARFHTARLRWTVPFVVFGLWRFYGLLDDRDTAQSPTDRMLRDRVFVANAVVAVAAMLAIIYGGAG